jgi:DNA polymerase
MTEDYAALTDSLIFQVESGADEAINDDPLNRFEAPNPQPAPALPASIATRPDPVAIDTHALAAAASSLEALRATMDQFDGCALKKGARNFVFSDGNPAAHLMIIGEAPGAEEDRQGRPFVGKSGQLLDRMLGAIGLDRHAENPERAAYITNVIPWRPPGNRDPSADEVAMMRPFLIRHIQLARPKVLLLLGNPSMKTVLQIKEGITRMRGNWAEVEGVPTMPSFHPAALLRDPQKKRFSWQDLQSIRRKLDEG